MLITLIASVGGVVAYYKLGSSLILVYGLENFADFFSSLIVLWRFYLPPSSDAAEEARLLGREKRASVGISIMLAILGFGTIVSSLKDFANGKDGNMESLNVMYYISLVSIFAFGLLAFVKLHFAKILNSSSLRKDGICSAMGSVLAVTLFLNSSLTMASNGSLWWLEPFVAISCGIASFVYGLKGVYKAYVKEGAPIFTISWWLYGGQKNMELEMPVDRESGGMFAGPGIGSSSTMSPQLPKGSLDGPPTAAVRDGDVGAIGAAASGDELLNGNDDIEDIALT